MSDTVDGQCQCSETIVPRSRAHFCQYQVQNDGSCTIGNDPISGYKGGGGHFAKLGLPSRKRINACLLPHPLREVLDSTFLASVQLS